MKKRHSAEQIVLLLREADVELGKGEKVPEVCRKLGITQQTYYRWRTKYGSMEPKLAKQLQELQKENARLKRLVAEQALDMQILREAARPNLEALSAGGGQSKLSASAWGLNSFPNGEHAGCWSSLVARSVTNRRRSTRIASCWGRCGGWSSFIRDMAASECMAC